MHYTTQNFSFRYPLKHKIVRDLKIITEHIGNLEVEGIGYFYPAVSVLDIFEKYTVDIDFVRWNGTDIKPVLDVTGVLEDIQEAAVRHFADVFENGIHQAA